MPIIGRFQATIPILTFIGRMNSILSWVEHEKSFTSLYAIMTYEPRHEISNNVVCATIKASDQPAHTRSLIRAFASRLNILWLLSHLEFLSLKGGCTGLSESTLVKCHIDGNHMSRFNYIMNLTIDIFQVFFRVCATEVLCDGASEEVPGC